MKFRATTLAVLASLAMVSSFARADAIDLGVQPAGLDSFASSRLIKTTGSFEDTIAFSLAGAKNLRASAVANTIASDVPGVDWFHISNGALALFSGKPGDAIADTQLGSVSFGSTSSPLPRFTLAQGDYYFKVSGIVDGEIGGMYLVNGVTTPPVPEPETYAMLLAGLGLLGFAARKRKAA